MPFQSSKKLLIGVSSAVGYFHAEASEKGRPAPILEASPNCCLLYDEIWFFTRDMCPYNAALATHVRGKMQARREEGWVGFPSRAKKKLERNSAEGQRDDGTT